MKVLFLHLSDMHFVSDSSYTKKDCEELGLSVKLVAKEFDAKGILDVIAGDVFECEKNGDSTITKSDK